MRKRLLPFGLLVLCVLVAISGLAIASSGGGTDPDDADSIDIRSFGHSDDDTTVTFFIETWETFDNTTDFGPYTADWELDVDKDTVTRSSDDSCMSLKSDGEGGMQASINDCGSETGSTATATFPAPTTGAKRAQFSFPIDAFRTESGIGNETSYSYGIVLKRFTTARDTAPDSGLVTHTFGSGPTPTPTSAPTPTPTPTPSESATPTPTPTASGATPTPTPTPTPGPNDTAATGTPSKSSVNPGESLSLSATSGFKANTSLTAVMNSDPVTLASITANATGGFTATVTIPSSAAVGSHTIEVSGANNNNGTHRLKFPITVLASSTTSTTSSTGTASSGGSGATLPNTGVSIAVFVLIAGALMLVGFELIGKNRKLQNRELR